jgi:lysophospholipid acyltransferase (LPLAT)-like uncharacterized protein
MKTLKERLDILKINFVGYTGALILWALRKTLRLKKIVPAGESLDWSGEEPRILVFWHGHQLMMPWIYLDSRQKAATKPMNVLISKSKDGRFIAKAMQVLGIDSIAGSSSRGGKEALIKLVRLVKGGNHIAITPDGPKGPRHKMKVGALKVSQLTGARLVPSCFAAKDYWSFKSWDGMILPKPFSKAVLLTGQSMIVPRKASEGEISALANIMEEELNKITEEAAAMFHSKTEFQNAQNQSAKVEFNTEGPHSV